MKMRKSPRHQRKRRKRKKLEDKNPGDPILHYRNSRREKGAREIIKKIVQENFPQTPRKASYGYEL